MRNISNECLEEMAAEDIGSDVEFAVSVMARELLEYRKASREPVAYIFKHPAGKLFWSLTDESNKDRDDVFPVHSVPPAPVAADGWENCKNLLPIGELIHRLEEQTGEKWIYAKDAIPDGCALVPIEPTREMLEAGDEKFGTYDVYRRMLSVAPQPGDVSKK